MKIGPLTITKESSVSDYLPQLVICDPDKDGTLVAVHIGHDGSDPLLAVSARFPRPLDEPFVRLNDWQWKRRHRAD